jgi:CDP-diacylglycerol--glycerol-3-phosphate 3-phosphatidyltransferase
VPSVYQFKPAFQHILRPAARQLARFGVTANEVTLAATILSVIQGAIILWQPADCWPLLFMPLMLLVRLALNAIDGILAREHGSASDLGVVLNELGDLLSDMALYLPLALVPGVPGPLLVVAVCLGLVSEATGLVAKPITGARGNQGPMGKSDRAVLFGALALALGLRLLPGAWVTGLLILTIVMLAKTIANRAGGALRSAAQSHGKEIPGTE